jgi:hypothetical protein
VRLASLITILLLTFPSAGFSAGPAYDLKQTEGMNLFSGSAEAAKILERQGFVVAAPEYRQIFEPYLESDLPVFVTPDTAWHTYHMLLEEGVKEMERTQSARLREFSKLLLNSARAQASNGVPEFSAIADYASIGLAFQEPAQRELLDADQKRLLASLTNGSAPVTAPIGFQLSPVMFRPQSFYTESVELSDFYRARTWYASVDYRLSDERETLLALCLSWLVESDAQLLKLWKQLSDPYDAFVAPPDDATVPVYTAAAKALLGGQFGPVTARARLADIRKKLGTTLPVPRINDQALSPDEFSRFADTTRGFRLLPTRQLPCGVCFQNTVEPKIHDRFLPSGLDFMVASPVMRSAAATRALEGQFGKPVLEAVQKADCPPMPRSLYGQSMEVLAKLQVRLPGTAPSPLRTEAWSDLQLWMQLGAWAEQRHTWALYSKMGALTRGTHTPPPGIVAPFPAFFSGLARLSRDSAAAFESIVADERFEPKALAAELYRLEVMVRNNYSGMSEQEKQRMRPEVDHHSRFIRAYYAAHMGQMNDARELYSDLDEMLKRVAEAGQANAEETKTLRMYFECRQFAPPMLGRLAEVCDRLAVLAQKQLAGEALTHDDADWVRGYGQTIAGLQGYWADTWPDEFPIISRVFHDQFNGSILYVGVARPQSLYVVLPYKGGLQLYRGAVLNYREFARPEDQSLDDNSWRAMVKEGKAPPAPPFTRSFLSIGAAAPGQQSGSFTPGLKPGKPATILVALKEASLGPAPKVLVRHEGWLTMSEDCRHVAYRAHDEGKWWVVRDGVPGRKYDDVSSMMFSPNGEHLAYVARTGSNSCVVLDELQGDPFSSIPELTKQYWPFVFSENSQHLAYIGSSDGRNYCVVVDGKRGPMFDEVLHHSFSFSDNSEHYTYAARRDGKGIVVKDGKEVLTCSDVFSSVQQMGREKIGDTYGPFLSADGEHLACAIRKGTNWVVSVDGKESTPWDSISELDLDGPAAGFSPDGRHFTYVGQRGQKFFVVVDQKEYPTDGFYCAAFSPDTRHMAFVRTTTAQDGRRRNCVVLDGVAGKEFPGEIEHLTFSPDGNKLAYRVKERMGVEYFVLHGGPEFDDYDAQRDFEFSPDSKHYAFLGARSGATYFVVDGKANLKSMNGMGGGFRSDYFTFSPDSERWAYISERERSHYAVISGFEYGPYDFIGEPDEEEYIYFSPDNRHFAFMATRDYWTNNYSGRQFLVVDGRDYALDGATWLNGSVLRFDSPTKLHGLISSADRIAVLEVEIHE